ncbi:hypothetical protein D9M70_599000 [compost metagenome]
MDIRTIFAITGNRNIDQLRIDLHQRLVIDAKALCDARTIVLQKHVGSFHKVKKHLFSVW